jgi:hypothetical protein
MIKFILQKLFPQTIDEIVSEEIQLRDTIYYHEYPEEDYYPEESDYYPEEDCYPNGSLEYYYPEEPDYDYPEIVKENINLKNGDYIHFNNIKGMYQVKEILLDGFTIYNQNYEGKIFPFDSVKRLAGGNWNLHKRLK